MPHDVLHRSHSHHSAIPWLNPLVFIETTVCGYTSPTGDEAQGDARGGQLPSYKVSLHTAIDKYGVLYQVVGRVRLKMRWLLHVTLPQNVGGPGDLVLDHTTYVSSVHEQQHLLRWLAECIDGHHTATGELPSTLTKEMVYL